MDIYLFIELYLNKYLVTMNSTYKIFKMDGYYHREKKMYIKKTANKTNF